MSWNFSQLNQIVEIECAWCDLRWTHQPPTPRHLSPQPQQLQRQQADDDHKDNDEAGGTVGSITQQVPLRSLLALSRHARRLGSHCLSSTASAKLTQDGFGKARALLVGLGGLGAEVAKNVSPFLPTVCSV